ncbi:AAA family ATPase [Collimonas humicola]|uniref:AAA family ATPase n=1 Tax=Collimonas humicola TaxID=2825886 RepID=UPI001B8BE46B|nr:AAA family ATPase [Collimonas humicola]
MSTATLIIGESGTGKTASLRNLDPSSTLLIQAIRKPLSFKKPGWGLVSKDNPRGNIIVTDVAEQVIAAMHKTRRKVIVLDDFQYVMADEFMRRSQETGFQKFTDIGRNAWDIFNAAAALPPDVRVYILSHSVSDEFGKTRCKSLGKLLDDKITIEGMFTIVLKTVVQGGEYTFSTHNSGSDTVKTPMEMFEEDNIENDLAMVDATICSYYDLSQPEAA